MLQKTAIHHGLEHPVQVELNAADLMIADDLDFIGAARNLRGADADLFHFSLKISDPDDITDK